MSLVDGDEAVQWSIPRASDWSMTAIRNSTPARAFWGIHRLARTDDAVAVTHERDARGHLNMNRVGRGHQHSSSS
jgi:hypothetical protein